MEGYSLVVIWVFCIHTGHTTEQNYIQTDSCRHLIGSKVVNTLPRSAGISSGDWQKRVSQTSVAEKGQSSYLNPPALIAFTYPASNNGYLHCFSGSSAQPGIPSPTLTASNICSLDFLAPSPLPLPMHTFNPLPPEAIKFPANLSSSCFHLHLPVSLKIVP